MFFAALAHSGEGAVPPAPTFRVGGTGSGSVLIRQLADDYLRVNPQVRIEISMPPMGSGGAQRALQAKKIKLLVRVICQNCSEPHPPEPHELEWLKYELGDRIGSFKYAKGRGCAHCANTGYQGRQAVYEFLEMTNALVEAANHGDPNEFMAIGRQQMGGHTLRRDAVRLVVNGRTTIEEAMRISTQLDE